MKTLLLTICAVANALRAPMSRASRAARVPSLTRLHFLSPDMRARGVHPNVVHFSAAIAASKPLTSARAGRE